MCRDLKKQAIRPSVWQTRIEALLGTVEQTDLVKLIDFDRLTRAFQYPDLGENTKYVTFPKIAGLPDDVQFVKKIFGMKQDRSFLMGTRIWFRPITSCSVNSILSTTIN